MNQFNEGQLETIETLAAFYWDNKVAGGLGNLPAEYLATLRGNYMIDITLGLTDPRYWELDI